MHKLISKFGLDKWAHFGIGGLITAIITIFIILLDIENISWWKVVLYSLIGTSFTVIISIIKEKYIDSYPDWKDLFAAIIGSILVLAASLLGVLL